jgi:antitoxin component YwqK of YwqJK toxin-antitoxin module
MLGWKDPSDEESEMQRVELNKLLDEGDGTYSYGDSLFSGVAFELFPDRSLWSETTFINGHQEGVGRTWYENGQLKSEGWFIGATLHGSAKEWFPSGKLKSVSLCEFGICLEEKEWDENEKLIRDFRLRPTDYNYGILQKYRTAFCKSD